MNRQVGYGRVVRISCTVTVLAWVLWDRKEVPHGLRAKGSEHLAPARGRACGRPGAPAEPWGGGKEKWQGTPAAPSAWGLQGVDTERVQCVASASCGPGHCARPFACVVMSQQFGAALTENSSPWGTWAFVLKANLSSKWTPWMGIHSYGKMVRGDTCEGCSDVGKWRDHWLAPTL